MLAALAAFIFRDEFLYRHCERGFRPVTLPPLEANGAVAGWFSK